MADICNLAGMPVRLAVLTGIDQALIFCNSWRCLTLSCTNIKLVHMRPHIFVFCFCSMLFLFAFCFCLFCCLFVFFVSCFFLGVGGGFCDIKVFRVLRMSFDVCSNVLHIWTLSVACWSSRGNFRRCHTIWD